ncbi:MAG: SRPBCC domain-containing protein [Pseudomonadales bacterium]|nr:SRPBCC domain-containing protein [Pseudomonadales bacterium]
MREVKTEIVIDAPREKVWQVLTDFDAYGNWNPVIKDVKATPQVNRSIRFKINLFGQKLPIAAKIQRCEENWYFGWGTDTSLPSNHIIGAHHFFELNPEGDNKTRLVHNEIFYGIVPKIVWPVLKKLKGSYEDMNQSLKTECESAA